MPLRLALLLFCSLLVQATFAADRPNVLFVIADDWGYPHASAYGAPVVKTPHFDRIAKEGVLFTNAFISAPSCSPSRSAILTGQYHWRLENAANLNAFLPAKFEIYPDILEKAGYFVGYMKKGYGPGNNGDRPRNPCGPNFKTFAEFLEKCPAGEPFCFWHGSIEPHRPYDWQAGEKLGMDPAKVNVPPFWPDDPTTRTDICDYYSEVQEHDRQLGELVAALEKVGELDKTLVIVTGDHAWPFPRGKTNLYDAGTHVPLAIRWPQKIKGGQKIDDLISSTCYAPTILEACGAPKLKAATGASLLPQMTDDGHKPGDADTYVLLGLERHVPCHLLENGVQGGYPARAIRTREYLLIHNYEPDRWPAGDPLLFAGPKEKYPTDDDLRKDTKLAFPDCDAGPTKALILTKRDDPTIQPFYELCFAKRPAWELYDLKNDPHQIKNVANDPAYRKQREKLEAKLLADLKATNDPRTMFTDRTPLDELPGTLPPARRN